MRDAVGQCFVPRKGVGIAGQDGAATPVDQDLAQVRLVNRNGDELTGDEDTHGDGDVGPDRAVGGRLRKRRCTKF